MKETKWYKKILFAIITVIFLPIIPTVVICVGLNILFSRPKLKKEYKNSHYYKDFKKKFALYYFLSCEYRFYNCAKLRNLPIEYVIQESNGFEYFIYDGTIFLFPNFDGISFDMKKNKWEVDYDGDWKDFESGYKGLLEKLDNAPYLPVKLLVSRDMFSVFNLNEVEIPECIFLTWSYEEAFENEDSELKMISPQNTKELYDMMRKDSDICGDFQLSSDNSSILWDVYENFRVEISIIDVDCYLSISKLLRKKYEIPLTHWHPVVFEIYSQVRGMGKRENVTVIQKGLFGAEVLYIGNKNFCPYNQKNKPFLKKLYFLEALHNF